MENYTKIEKHSNYTEYLNDKGERHRIEGPALEYSNGDKEWYLNDECHRENGPAIELANGSKFWYLNGKCHREDGPAVEYFSGYKYYYQGINLDFIKNDKQLKSYLKMKAFL